MTVWTKRGVEIASAYDAAGEARKVANGEMQVWMTEAERAIDGASVGRVDQVTWAELSAISGEAEGQPAQVVGPDAGTHTDPVTSTTVDNEGSYIWSSAPAGWRRVGGLPNEIVRATNTGDGTANDIQAVSIPMGFNTNPYQALISVNFLAENDGAMTVSFNGAPARELVTNTGAAVPPGYVQPGMAALVQIDEDGACRLFSYGDASAIQAAAEAARDGANAAAIDAAASAAAAQAAVPNVFPANIAALQAVNTSENTVAYLTDAARAGQFVWDASDLSADLLGEPIAALTVDAGTDTITSVGHGLILGWAVVVTTAVNGLATNTLYYVIKVDDDNFQLATSYDNAQNGSAVDLTGTDAMILKKHLDPCMGVHVTPAGDISGASGAWVRVTDGHWLTPGMFGAVGDATGDDSHALNAAADFIRDRRTADGFYPYAIDGEHKIYRHTRELDFTNIRWEGWGFVNTSLHSACAGQIACNFAGSFAGYLDKLLCNGDETDTPTVGFYMGRTNTGANKEWTAGLMATEGKFSMGAYVNIGSDTITIADLRPTNSYWAANSASDIFCGEGQVVTDFCGALPTSVYRDLTTTGFSVTNINVGRHNPRKTPAYRLNISDISLANPAVVTIDAADAALFDNATANQGLANGNRVYMEGAVTFANPSDSNAIRYRTYAIANIDTVNRTFELSGLNTSGFSAFVSGSLVNDSGPAFVAGHINGWKNQTGYIQARSSAKILLDATRDQGCNNLRFAHQNETAGRFLIEIRGDGTDRTLRNFHLEDYNSASIDSPIRAINLSGGADINLENPTLLFGHQAQAPNIGLFNNPLLFRGRGGTVYVPEPGWFQGPSLFDEWSAAWIVGSEVSGSNVIRPAHRVSLIPKNLAGNAQGDMHVDTTGHLLFHDGTNDRDVQVTRAVSASALNAIGNAINTIGKFEGKMVYSTTDNRPVFASGSSASHAWRYSDGTVAYTPS